MKIYVTFMLLSVFLIGFEKHYHKNIDNNNTENRGKTVLTNGFLLYPMAPHDKRNKTNRALFLKEFPKTLETLKENGINTIFVVTNRLFFHFQNDNKLKKYTYPKDRGYTPEYFKEIARIARKHKMKIVVYYNAITHCNASVISRVYPDYMQKGQEWKQNVEYFPVSWNVKNNGYVIEHKNKIYRAKKHHTSTSDNEPGKGANWQKFWDYQYRDLLDPLNDEAQQKTRDMLFEIIDAFTVDNVVPDGIHLGGDEAWLWAYLNCDTKNGCNGMTHAELFANQINNMYKAIKNRYPNIDVYIWGDMLGKYANGIKAKTADALKTLNKNIIIVDWKYHTNENLGFNKASQQFESVKEFADAGFSVLTAGWKNQDASKLLVQSGKLLPKNKKKYIGHLNTVWYLDTLDDIIKGLKTFDPSVNINTLTQKEKDTKGVVKSIKAIQSALK